MNRFALAFLLSTTCLYLSPILPISALIFPNLVVIVWCLKNHNYIVAGLFSGVSLLCVHSYFFEIQQLPAEFVGVDIEVIGRITGIPRRHGNTVLFNFELDKVIAEKDLSSTPKNLRLSCYQCQLDPRSGETWLLTVRLKPGRGLLNPGAFDYEKWLRAKGIDAVGYVRTKSENRLLDPTTGVLGFRGYLSRELQALPLTTGAQALTRALALGDGSQLGQRFWDVLRKTGTSHLMVISGLHITLIAASVASLFSLLWRPLTHFVVFRVSRVGFSFSMGVVAAMLYAGLAGFTVPTVRALIMLLAYWLFLRTRRHMGAMKPLAVSLIVVLIFQPYSSLQPGFWLSFFAVAFIHFYLTTKGVGENWLFAYLHWHFALTIGMAPITVFFFGYLSLTAMVANAVAVPLVSILVVPMVLFGGALLFALPSVVGIVILELASWVMSVLLQGLSLLAEFEFSQVWVGRVTIWHCLVFLIGVVIWLVPLGFRFHWLTVPLISSVFLFDFNTLKDREFDVKVIDVGQGLSVLLSTKNHHLLFDTGGRLGRGRSMAVTAVLPVLRFEGVEKLDKLIISHPDSDHAAGVEDITHGIIVDSVVTEISFASEINTRESCQHGDSWMWDGVRFEFLNSPSSKLRSENNRSCVLMVSSGDSQVMLPGDIEKEGERQLASTIDKQEIELIVAPHHGSRTSSTRELLARINPLNVVFAVGWRNRYGFPHADVVERYNEFGTEIYRTDRDGMLTFRFDEDGIKGKPSAYRNAHHEFWRSDFDLRLQ